MSIVVYKDGTYKKVEQSWEFENDPDWLVTIDLEDSAVKALEAEVVSGCAA